jgi:hypothetical protein
VPVYRLAKAVLRLPRSARRAVHHIVRYPGWRARLRSGRYRIGVQTVVINSFDGLVWGDECMARGLAHAFVRLGHSSEVVSSTTHDIDRMNFDVMIAMYPTGEIPGLPYRIALPATCLNLYWAQVPEHYLQAQRDPRFAGFMFASQSEMRASTAAHKLWLPMSADAESYRPISTPVVHDVVFCANNIAGRSAQTLEKFLGPILAIPGIKLSIRGSWWEKTPYAPYCHGSIHPGEVPQLYSSAKVVLSIHGDAHTRADMPTSRLFEAAACECAILSDELPTAKQIFGDAVCWTEGGHDLQEKLIGLLRDDARRENLARAARAVFLRSGTFDAQATRIGPFLREIIDDRS